MAGANSAWGIDVGVSAVKAIKLRKDGGRVTDIRHVRDVGMQVNGGFFVMRREVFEWLRPGEELVQEPFQRLAQAGKLAAYPYNGFWACMDTFKEKQLLEDLYSRGQMPWQVWRNDHAPSSMAR